jgi:antitoxin VapB
MLSTAKLFQNGQSQAVRLPKEFRFENMKEVFIKKVNGMVVLIPKTDTSVWNTMFDHLDDFSDDFMQIRTEPAQKREELF